MVLHYHHAVESMDGVDEMPIKNRISHKKSEFLILSNANYLFLFFPLFLFLLLPTAAWAQKINARNTSSARPTIYEKLY